MNPFKVGDAVTAKQSCSASYITHGTKYIVTHVNNDYVHVVDDDGDDNYYEYWEYELYTGSQTAVPSPHIPDHTAAVLGTDDSVEDDYETRKASARVTSAGRFEVGQSVVYSDGTPTPDGLTVVRCTATCVWFEETYSMPFNPDEFIRIEDEY